MRLALEDKLRLLEPIIGSRKCHGIKLMALAETDYRQKAEIESMIDLLLARHLKDGIQHEIALPPPDADVDGDIEIGTVEYLDKEICPFGLKHKDINRHVGIFGSTGSGKTTLAKNLIKSLHHQGIPVLIIDWEQSYRSLIAQIPEMQIFTAGSSIAPLHLNPFHVPPGISTQEYIKSLLSIISHDYLGGQGSDTIMLQFMDQLYKQFDNPSWSEFVTLARVQLDKEKRSRTGFKGRSGLWKETVLRQLIFMSYGSSGQVLKGKDAFDPSAFLSTPCIIELGGIKSPQDRKFFVHLILNYILLYLHHQGMTSDKLKSAIVFEEFHNIAMRGSEDNLVSNLFREVRKYGMGLIAIDQTPSEIPNAVYANMNAKISFNLSTNTDIKSIGSAINLPFFQHSYLSKLPTGKAIVKVAQASSEPFLVHVPFQTSPELFISDDQLKRLQADMMQCSGVPKPKPCVQASSGGFTQKESLENSPPRAPPQREVKQRKCETPGDETLISLDPVTQALPEEEQKIFSSIISSPFESIRDRCKSLSIHPKVMVSACNSLEQKELVRVKIIGTKKLFELTDFGKRKADLEGITIPKSIGRGGIEHAYAAHQIKNKLKKLGIYPKAEVGDIDLSSVRDSLAIEIETGKSDIKKNCQKLSASPCRYKYMVATTKEALAICKREAAQVSSAPPITTLHIRDFLAMNGTQIFPILT